MKKIVSITALAAVLLAVAPAQAFITQPCVNRLAIGSTLFGASAVGYGARIVQEKARVALAPKENPYETYFHLHGGYRTESEDRRKCVEDVTNRLANAINYPTRNNTSGYAQAFTYCSKIMPHKTLCAQSLAYATKQRNDALSRNDEWSSDSNKFWTGTIRKLKANANRYKKYKKDSNNMHAHFSV